MEISIGDYVRSWNGTIGKVTRIEEGRFLYDNKELICFIGSVVKHSKDIIDLIQKDDYVNGHLVIHKYTDTYYGQVILIEKALAEAEEKFLKNKDIKSVITAEQIKQIEFRIKE